MKIEVKIKTAEEFLRIEGVKLNEGNIKVEGKIGQFVTGMYYLMGKSFTINTQHEDTVCVDGKWFIQPWMCSEWDIEIVEEDFKFYELVECRDWGSDEWHLCHFIGIDEDEEEYRYKTTTVSREIYDNECEKGVNPGHDYWRQIRKIK